MELKPVPQTHPVPAKAGNLVTLVDRCWVCDRIFPAYGGREHGLVQHFHHIIPRAFGGINGPTISVCTGHHDMLHRLAEKMISGRVTNPPNATLMDKRIRFLATKAAEAELKLGADPNKHLGVTVTGNSDFIKQVDWLSTYYGTKSRSETLRVLVENTFSKLSSR